MIYVARFARHLPKPKPDYKGSPPALPTVWKFSGDEMCRDEMCRRRNVQRRNLQGRNVSDEKRCSRNCSNKAHVGKPLERYVRQAKLRKIPPSRPIYPNSSAVEVKHSVRANKVLRNRSGKQQRRRIKMLCKQLFSTLCIFTTETFSKIPSRIPG